MTAAPDWLHDAVFYQIFPDRFANSNPDADLPDTVAWESEPTPTNFFGGDLEGMTQHLDHIASLGANGIYLNPIFEADTNHRYDGKNYFAVDPRLGDLAAFRRFIDSAHGVGIKVILDGVFNHSGIGHPYFQDVMEHEGASDYVNWYSVENFPVTSHPVPNYRTFAGCWDLPKWNVYNPLVRQHHLDVASFWLDEGIDGWRLDVPWLVPHGFWRQFRELVKRENSEAYIVAEEWREPEQWLQGDMCDGTMNYTLRALILGFTTGSLDAVEFSAGVNTLRDRIPDGFHHGMLNVLGSHDTERVLTTHSGNRSRCALAHSLMFLSQGAPMVYYGDEVGLTGENDPGCRGSVPWDESAWDGAMVDHVRGLTALRANTAALRRGTQDCWAVDPDTVALVRDWDGARVIGIVHRGSGIRVETSSLPILNPVPLLGEAGHDPTGFLVGPDTVLVLTGQPAANAGWG
ncbi:MAG: glycoside hydrolase family 13 protein [Propionibacteriaceae bacterium]|jgi:glycosidase|nr:glycoside hydrolase family 13 protein [Propionibacteriaceae bacterium]